MTHKINRRDILKLLSLLSLVQIRVPMARRILEEGDPDETPNIIILLFDTLSAYHVSLYGYPRETMPNIARFADRSTVYHRHYASGNYTTPSTASILTGTYPWTHRALSHQSTPLARFESQNLFSGFGNSSYTRLGFTQNFLANILLHNFRGNIDRFMLSNETALVDFNLSDNLFRQDLGLASQAERVYLDKPGKVSNSLFLAPLLASYQSRVRLQFFKAFAREYPLGIPGRNDMLYPLEDSVDWLIQQIPRLQQPFLSYFHFMPPHDPYRPSLDFVGIFKDGWEPPIKPEHHFSEGVLNQRMNRQRRMYDEFIAYVDTAFGRILRSLSEQGLMQNTWLIFTSDHGEMFERGIWKHTTPVLYQPLLRIPLLIAQPGQSERIDVHATTSCVDILPTLLHVTGRDVPDGIEGKVLPPFGGEEPSPERAVFAVEAKSNQKYKPLNKATMSMIKGDFKIIHYIGYEDGFTNVTELYDIVRDPEEMNDLTTSHAGLKDRLLDELLAEKERAEQDSVGS
jgi:arylsulfatase A-like enzyme